MLDNSDRTVHQIPAFSHGPMYKHPMSNVFALIRDGAVLPETIGSVSNVCIRKHMEFGKHSLSFAVFAYYCDVGLYCRPMPSYFDLMLTESIITYLELPEHREIADRTVENLLDCGPDVFRENSAKAEGTWDAPSIVPRYLFLLNHISRLGSGLRPNVDYVTDAVNMLIPPCSWLDSLEKKVRELTLKEASRKQGRIAQAFRGTVPSGPLARQQKAIVEKLIRMGFDGQLG